MTLMSKFKSDVIQIQPQKLPSESFSAGWNITGTISDLRYTSKSRRSCNLVNNSGLDVDAAVAVAKTGLQFPFKGGAKNTTKGFSYNWLWQEFC